MQYRQPTNRFGSLWIGMVLVLIYGLCGCVSQSLSSQPKPESCEQHCLKRALACCEVCHNTCPICQFKSKQRTKNSYDRYEWVQHAQGKVVARELNAFRDPLACTKVSCDCQADYHTCKKACTGYITPRLRHKQCIDSEIPYDSWFRDILAG